MLWLYLIPTWLLAITIIGATVAISLAGFLIVDPWIRKSSHPGNDVVYCFMAATGLIYALVLGLFAVATWDSLKGLEEISMKEALQAGKLYWDLAGYAPSERDHLRPMIKQYLHTVIEKEWPQQRQGITGPDPQLLTDLTVAWMRVEPVTEGQKLAHAEALQQLNELLSLRRARREGIKTQLPPSLWTAILLGAVLNIGMSYLILTERSKVHLIMVGCSAAMIGLMIFVIAAVDHPLWGQVSVPPDGYEEVLSSLNP